MEVTLPCPYRSTCCFLLVHSGTRAFRNEYPLFLLSLRFGCPAFARGGAINAAEETVVVARSVRGRGVFKGGGAQSTPLSSHLLPPSHSLSLTLTLFSLSLFQLPLRNRLHNSEAYVPLIKLSTTCYFHSGWHINKCSARSMEVKPITLITYRQTGDAQTGS